MQTFLNETHGTSTLNDEMTSAGYPKFNLNKTSATLGYYSPKGYFDYDESVFGRFVWQIR